MSVSIHLIIRDSENLGLITYDDIRIENLKWLKKMYSFKVKD